MKVSEEQVNYYSTEMLSAQDRKDPKKIGSQIESMFFSMLFKQMRSGKLAEDVLGSSQMDSIQEMHDQQLSLSLGSKGFLGISDLISGQLEQKQESFQKNASFGLLKGV